MSIASLAVGAPPVDSLVDFRTGCALLRISPRTADRHAEDAASDLPRWFKKGGRKFYWRHDIAEFWARKAAETRRKSLVDPAANPLPKAVSAPSSAHAAGGRQPRVSPAAVGQVD